MGERILTEKEKDTIASMICGMDEAELEFVVNTIPVEWLIYGAQCQTTEMRAQLVGHEQIVKGQVCTYGHGQ